MGSSSSTLQSSSTWDYDDNSVSAASAAGAVGRMGSRNIVTTQNLSTEVTKQAFEYAEKAAESIEDTNARALDSMSNTSSRALNSMQYTARDAIDAATQANRDSLRFGSQAINGINSTSNKALDNARAINSDSMRYAKDITGEAFENISESSERASQSVNNAISVANLQTKEAVGALTKIITQNQIGATEIQSKNIDKLIVSVAVVLAVGFIALKFKS